MLYLVNSNDSIKTLLSFLESDDSVIIFCDNKIDDALIDNVIDKASLIKIVDRDHKIALDSIEGQCDLKFIKRNLLVVKAKEASQFIVRYNGKIVSLL